MSARVVLIILAASVSSGCASKPYEAQRPKLVPVHGVVRYNGKPLDAARVTFAHAATGVSAYGVTDAEGKFTLTSFEPGDGAPPGKYQVAVSKAQETVHRPANGGPPVFRPGGAPRPHWLIPPRYANLATSKLTADVGEAGSDEIILDLNGS
jgi:hypothetical protein